MSLIVQKYGGSSLGDSASMHWVAKRIECAHQAGHDVVVVVSAQKGVTNKLVQSANSMQMGVESKEMAALLASGESMAVALLTMALQGIGVPAVSRTGIEAGIKTDDYYCDAQIKTVSGGDLKECLSKKQVVVVAGFQGGNSKGEITTLGRGGSDLTAVALAKSLDADRCEIYTDVEGVFSADPKIVSDAHLLSVLSYEELTELSLVGYKVMQARAAQYAMQHHVPFVVKGTFLRGEGTFVGPLSRKKTIGLVKGVALDSKVVQVRVKTSALDSRKMALLLGSLREERIFVDMMMHSKGGNDDFVSFVLPQSNFIKAQIIMEEVLQCWREGQLVCRDDLSKVSIVGGGMILPQDASMILFDTLAKYAIPTIATMGSEARFSVLVPEQQAKQAVSCIHKSFFQAE